MIWQVSPLKAHIASGAVKPIASLSATRIASFPHVPTLAETLLPGFDSSAWFGVLAPAGTPKPIVERLYASVKRALDTAEVAKRFESLGLERADAGPAKFREIIAQDLKRWRPVIDSTKSEAK
jgi:tripartite-type tricarboxylate transporter receptor subunit TctC